MLELTLTHDGSFWKGENESICARGKTLVDLDQNIEMFLKKNDWLQPGKPVHIKMNFDNATIPGWIRQYANHYFNRIVIFNP